MPPQKTALITGGSSGIGLELSKILAENGYAVFSLDKTPSLKEALGVIALQADITNPEEIRSAIAQIPGSIDILINNAGIMRRGDVFESSPEDFDALFSVLVKGSWLMLRETRGRMSDCLLVLQVLSAHALRPAKDPGLYSLAKQGAWNLLQNLRRDFPEYTVKFAFPGPVDTPLARYGLSAEKIEEKIKIMHRPEDVAQKIFELLKSDTCTELIFDNKTWAYELR